MPAEIILTTEVLSAPGDTILEDSLAIRRGSFPQKWQFDGEEDYYRQKNLDSSSIHVFLRYSGKRVGYLLGIPQNEAVTELKPDDPEMKEDLKMVYVEVAAVLSAFRGKGGFSLMMGSLREEALKRGMQRFSLHARINNGLSGVIRKKFKVICSKRIERWPYYNHEEPTDYIEASFDGGRAGSDGTRWPGRTVRLGCSRAGETQ